MKSKWIVLKKKLGGWQMPALMGGILLVLVFYGIGDSETIQHNVLLNGGDWLGAALCHRIPERSFVILGRAMPLCARCSGIYLGIFLTFAVWMGVGRTRHVAFPRTTILLILLSFVAVMGVDGLNSYSHFFQGLPHLYTPHNWLRVLTGMGAGLALGNLIFPALMQMLWRGGHNRPALRTLPELFFLCVLGLVLVILIWSNQPLVLYVLGVISVAGILLVFTSINTIFLLAIFKQEGLYYSWREASKPLALGLILTVVELSLLSAIRLLALGTIAGIPNL